MSGTSYYSEPFDMAGFRFLRVEANFLDDPARSFPPVGIQVEGTDDLNSERKNWAWTGLAMSLNPRTLALGDYAETGRLARVRVDLPSGLPPKRLWIRLTRLD